MHASYSSQMLLPFVASTFSLLFPHYPKQYNLQYNLQYNSLASAYSLTTKTIQTITKSHTSSTETMKTLQLFCEVPPEV